MKFFGRRKREADAARAAAVEKAAEQAGALVAEAQKTYDAAKELNKRAVQVDQAFRAEIQRNRWTDTLFGVIETGRQ